MISLYHHEYPYRSRLTSIKEYGLSWNHYNYYCFGYTYLIFWFCFTKCSFLVYTLEMLYYENGQLLSQSSAPVLVNMSLPQEASLLSVGSYKGLGGFSTMRMSNFAFWTHTLSKQEVKEMYLKSKLINVKG